MTAADQRDATEMANGLDLTYVLLDRDLTLDNSPVFQSQILDWIRLQREGGLRVGVVCTMHDEQRFEDVVAEPLREQGVPVLTVANGTLLSNIWNGARALHAFNAQHPARCAYARGIWGAYAHMLAFPRRRPSLIYDFRGDLVAEAAQRGASTTRLTLLRLLCRGAFARADRLICVSSQASTVLAEEYGRADSVVIPSAVDAEWFGGFRHERERIRQSIGLTESDVLLVYAGGMNPYQMLPEMLRVWADLQQDTGIRFLLLLANQPVGGERPDLAGVDRIHGLQTMSVPRQQIPEYLAAADIGFLLRREHPLNAVASPVKFGEYLASGLAIVTSPGVGDVSRIVEACDVGALVRPDDHEAAVAACRELIDRVRRERAEFRRRALAAVVSEKWDWRPHLAIWRELVGSGVARCGLTTRRPTT